MQAEYLFPHRYRILGWFLVVPSALAGLLLIAGVIPDELLGEWPVFAIYAEKFLSEDVVFGFIKNTILDELICLLLITGLLLIAFSAEPHEDEFIKHLRLASLVWAAKANYVLLMFFVLFFYEGGFLYALLFNMFTLLVLFVLRFKVALWRSNTTA